MTKARNIAELANDISVDNNRDVTLSNLRSDQPMMFRNRIINGDMRIDQRNAGSAITASGNTTSFWYPLDRSKAYRNTNSTAEFTLQQVSDAPSNSSFDKSYKITVTTADTSPSYLLVPFEQTIEGNNIYDLELGTLNAKTFTVSFWVKCSLSGELPVAVFNGPSLTTFYVKNVTVTADTWHYKTLTIQGATSEIFGSTNTAGLYLSIGAAGPVQYQAASEGVWSTGGSVKEFLSDSLNIFGTNGATLQITGVQLEEGTVPTPFEHRPYGTELALCQRYYQKSYDIGTAPGTDVSASYIGLHTGNGVTDTATNQNVPFTIHVNPTMRAQPTFYYYSLEGTLNRYNTFTAGAMTRSETATTLGGFWRGVNSISGYTAPGASYLYGFCYVLTAEL